MKKLLLPVFFLLLSLVTTAQQIEPRPNPPRLVNDYAHVLTPDQKETLERKLTAYNDSTSTQIAVIIVQTTGDYDIQEVALKYLRKWGVGTAEKDNGVVLLAAINDRKIRIETGYGMEGVLPDITAKQIIDNEIVPNFKAGNYYRGFDEATDAIIKAAAGEYKAEKHSKKERGIGKTAFIILVIMFILIAMISRGGGGGGGDFLGGMLLGSMLGGSGRGGGSWGSSSSGWGSGGGFGGFGGGSGGGGGASGSW